MKNLVLISGKAESGKDTVANIIKDNSKGKAHILHMATELKDLATSFFGWNGEKDEKGRYLLQLLGDGGRGFDKEIWVNKMITKLRGLHANAVFEDDTFIISDIRYLNEIEFLQYWAVSNDINFYTIRVERSSHTSRLTEEQLQNASEVELDKCQDWDYVIYNDGSLADLRNMVFAIQEAINV